MKVGHAGVRGKVVADSRLGERSDGAGGSGMCSLPDHGGQMRDREQATRSGRKPHRRLPSPSRSVPRRLSWGRGGAVLPPSFLTGSKGNTGAIWTLGLFEASTLPAPAPTLHS